MPNPAPVVVHVVGSGGVNVAAIVATVVTGLLGALGIVATWLQGKRGRETDAANLKASIDAAADNLRLSIRAESSHADWAEKLRIYAHCLIAINNGLSAAFDKREGQRDAVKAEMAFSSSSVELANAIAEVELIGPRNVAIAAQAFYGALMDYERNGGDTRHVRARNDLLFAMKADLGLAGDAPAQTGGSPST